MRQGPAVRAIAVGAWRLTAESRGHGAAEVRPGRARDVDVWKTISVPVTEGRGEEKGVTLAGGGSVGLARAA